MKKCYCFSYKYCYILSMLHRANMMVHRRPDLHLYCGPTLVCNVWANNVRFFGSTLGQPLALRRANMMVQRMPDLHLHRGPTLVCNVWANNDSLVTVGPALGQFMHADVGYLCPIYVGLMITTQQRSNVDILSYSTCC